MCNVYPAEDKYKSPLNVKSELQFQNPIKSYLKRTKWWKRCGVISGKHYKLISETVHDIGQVTIRH